MFKPSIVTDDNYHDYKRAYGIPAEYWLYRENYLFGYVPSFRNDKDQPLEEQIFIYQGRQWKWSELKEDIRINWCPILDHDIMWKEANIGLCGRRA